MPGNLEYWDYLVVTVANEKQAAASRQQLQLRRQLGLLEGIGQAMAIADPYGRRIGSGGSTLQCLMKILVHRCGEIASDQTQWSPALSNLRILILHGGGQSARLPAYGPCGKLFLPVPGDGDSAVPMTLFDRQLASYRHLPLMPHGAGQIVIAAGDVLLNFDSAQVRFAPRGVSGLGCRSTPEQACGHGVFVAPDSGPVDLFLQKPSMQDQHRHGAVDHYGQTILDLGVVNLDAAAAWTMLRMSGARIAGGEVVFEGAVGEAILEGGLDFYRELCCAMGRRATVELHAQMARQGESFAGDQALAAIFQALHPLEFTVQVLGRCEFLHFGASAQLISSGTSLLRADLGVAHLETPLEINNEISPGGEIAGSNSWVEGCRIAHPLTLGGQNLLAGLGVDQPLSLPAGACVDVLPGLDRQGRAVDFVRVYGVNDLLKLPLDGGSTFCGRPLHRWLAEAGLTPGDVWEESIEPSMRSAWTARLFPAVPRGQSPSQWLWLYNPAASGSRAKLDYLSAERFSLAEMVSLADPESFHLRRRSIRANALGRSLRRVFRLTSGFSAADLAELLRTVQDRQAAIADVLREAHFHNGPGGGLATFVFGRILHTLATAMEILAGDLSQPLKTVAGDFVSRLEPAQIDWLRSLGLLPCWGACGMGVSPMCATGVSPVSGLTEQQQQRNGKDRAGTALEHTGKMPVPRVIDWATKAKAVAFGQLSLAIISSGGGRHEHPVSALRSDEIVWGRAPARLDLGGGWSDTPPYSLEHGGCVINAAVNLNGQPPIQAYARVIEQPLIRIASIDQGTRLEIRRLEDLLDYRKATSDFGLAKAALALSGLSPECADWPAEVSLQSMLERFGGGIELTTLSAVPKGSGLGTSSILGAVILAVVQKMMGRDLTSQDLFHAVLRLEQALTTGGGWQDQIGAVVGGVKVVSADPGLVPQARVHYVPSDVLDPHVNNGLTLLYYTGITRLAKNILQQVVGNYLDRNRESMATLGRIRALPPQVSAAMAAKDLPAFGRLIDVAWRFNKELDPDSSNPQIEALLGRLRGHLHGAKLLGAGGGGFLLMIAKSIRDAAEIRHLLESSPPNPRARFFDFSICHHGLAVTTC